MRLLVRRLRRPWHRLSIRLLGDPRREVNRSAGVIAGFMDFMDVNNGLSFGCVTRLLPRPLLAVDGIFLGQLLLVHDELVCPALGHHRGGMVLVSLICIDVHHAWREDLDFLIVDQDVVDLTSELVGREVQQLLAPLRAAVLWKLAVSNLLAGIL